MYVFILHWTISWSALPWGRSFLQLLAFQLPIVLCVVLTPRPHPLWHVHCCGPCPVHVWAVTWVDFKATASAIASWHNLTAVLWFSGSYSLPPIPLQCSLSLGNGSWFVDGSVGNGLHNSSFWLVVVFCNGFFLLQSRVSLLWDESYTYLWV